MKLYMHKKAEQIIEMLYKGTTYQELEKTLSLSNYEVNQIIWQLKNCGYLIAFENKTLFLDKTATHIKNNIDIKTPIFNIKEKFVMLVFSDTHFGMENDAIKEAGELLYFASEEEVDAIIHAGDLIQGNYDEIDPSFNSAKFINTEENIQYVAENLPKIKKQSIYLLSGNHDYRSLKAEGIDFIKLFSMYRKDFIHLGYEINDILLNNIQIVVHHPFSSSRSKTNSKTLKSKYYDKEIADFSRKQKHKFPKFIIRGHLHKERLYELCNGVVLETAPFFHIDNNPLRAYLITVNFNENILQQIQIEMLNVKHKVEKSEIYVKDYMNKSRKKYY